MLHIYIWRQLAAVNGLKGKWEGTCQDVDNEGSKNDTLLSMELAAL